MLPLHLNCDLHEFLTLKIVHNSASSNLSKFPLGCSYQAVPLEASAPWKQILVDSLHLLISPDFGDFPGGSDSKASAYNAGDPGLIPKILWRRKWHPTPVLLPGISHGQRRLVGYSLWGHKELDTIEWLHFHFFLSRFYSRGFPCKLSSLMGSGKVVYPAFLVITRKKVINSKLFTCWRWNWKFVLSTYFSQPSQVFLIVLDYVLIPSRACSLFYYFQCGSNFCYYILLFLILYFSSTYFMSCISSFFMVFCGIFIFFFEILYPWVLNPLRLFKIVSCIF